jgi:PilZ domain-containing protein
MLDMRANRFPLGLQVRYRRVDQSEWSVGNTENISHSGALVRVASAVQLDPEAELEVRLVLPAAAAGERAEIACRGRVVRTVSPTDVWPWPGFAVAIERYDFVPPPGARGSHPDASDGPRS